MPHRPLQWLVEWLSKVRRISAELLTLLLALVHNRIKESADSKEECNLVVVSLGWWYASNAHKQTLQFEYRSVCV